MKSFAIWCTKTDESPIEDNGIDIEAHFNLWRIKPSKDKINNSFLDIGIKIINVDKVSEINIYIPEVILKNKQEIEDLGVLFERDKDLASELFNEYYSVTPISGTKITTVKDGDEVKFYIYALDIDNDIKSHHKFNGTIFTIPITNNMRGQFTDTKAVYFRFRLHSQKLIQSLCRGYKPKNAIIESAFYKTEFIDFRLNSTRGLNRSLREEIHNKEPNFSKIHFFLICEAFNEYLSSHEEPSIRELENQVWKSYVGDRINSEIILAYHWRGLNNKDGFALFAKFKSLHTSWSQIGVFLLILIVISFIASLLANIAIS